MQWRSVLYGPLFNTRGVPAVLDLGLTGTFDTLRVCDLTAGLTLPGGVTVETTGPACLMRAGDLFDLELELTALDGGEVTFNGETHQIHAHRPIPSPNGIADGVVVLELEAAD